MNRCGCGCKAVLSLNTTPNSVIQIKDKDEPFLNMNTKDKGVDATINGVNTLTLTAEDGVELIQEGDVAKITGQPLKNEISSVSSDLDDEVSNRQNADLGLQNQIDIIAGNLSNYRTAADQDIIDNSQNTAINSKQDKLNTAQINAVNSGINATKVSAYDNHISNTNIHVTTQEKTTWNNKQNAIQDLDTIRSGASAGSTAVQPNDMVTAISAHNTSSQSHADIRGLIATNKHDILAETIARETADSALQTQITTEKTNRENADNGLQSQIDAIVASSDVTDIVGTYAQLQAYDTSTLPPNSIIKVLQDESRNNETTYYRWVINGGVGSWVLIGEEGPYYTKSEADERFATAAQGAKADTALQPSALNGYATQLWVGQQGFLKQAVDDNSTTSTTLGWSASKLNGIIGDIESTINAIRGV